MLLLPRYLSMEPTSPFSVNTLVSSPALTIYAPSLRGCIWINLQINNTPHPHCSLLVGRGLDSALAESRLQGARRGAACSNGTHCTRARTFKSSPVLPGPRPSRDGQSPPVRRLLDSLASYFSVTSKSPSESRYSSKTFFRRLC